MLSELQYTQSTKVLVHIVVMHRNLQLCYVHPLTFFLLLQKICKIWSHGTSAVNLKGHLQVCARIRQGMSLSFLATGITQVDALCYQ